MNVLTVAQAAEFLQVHEDTIYRLLEKGEIPAGKVRGSWRLIEEDLVDWIRSQYSRKAREPLLKEESDYFTNENKSRSDLSLLAECEEVLGLNEKKKPVAGSLLAEYDRLLGRNRKKTPKPSK